MKKLCLLSIVSLLFCFSVKSQTLLAGEYFVDTDPGQGNGTVISFTPADTLTGIQFTVNSTSIPYGYHYIYFRLKDSNGNWGHTSSKRFYVYSDNSIVVAPFNTQLVTGEYFIDADPGKGAGIPVVFVQSDSVSFDSLAIATTGLSFGYHFVYIRVKDDNGNWGQCRRKRFYIYDNGPATPSTDSVVLVQAEYWIDSTAVPGTGNLIALNPDDTIFYNDSIPGLQLDTGAHVISVRVKDSNGNWSYVKTDTVRTEVYDVDIDVVNRPFVRIGGWEKFEVNLKNRGNKDMFDVFIMLKVTGIDSAFIATDTDSIFGFSYKSAAAILPFNNVDFIPLWMYHLPKQSIKKFNLFLKLKNSLPPHTRALQEFEIVHDGALNHNDMFSENGDTSFFKQSKLFYLFYSLTYQHQYSTVQYQLADSLINFKIDSTLKKMPGLFSNCIFLNKMIQPLYAQSFNNVINDSLNEVYSEEAFQILRSSYFEQSFEDSINSNLNNISLSSIVDPCQPCTVNYTPVLPLHHNNNSNSYWTSSVPCVERCFCKCVGGVESSINDTHNGMDITMDPLNSSGQDQQDWDNGAVDVKAIFSGTVITSECQKPDDCSVGLGMRVQVQSTDGSFYITYGHLVPGTEIANGSSVTAGVTVIGKAGKSGRHHGGTHLHIEIRNSSNGVICNPSSVFADLGYREKASAGASPCKEHDPCIEETPNSCNPSTFKESLGQCTPAAIKDICKDEDARTSNDPNDKIGNEGHDSPRYIKYDDELHYGIFFENVDSATAPAQVVRIVDTLDLTKVDASTFYLESITAGEMLVVLPDNIHVQNLDTIYMNEPVNGTYVHIEATFDTVTGVVQFLLTSLDTLTLQPVTGALEGFLPPDTTDFNGNGLVSYKVYPVSTIPDDTVIYNKAAIIFDTNASITTGTWFNTIDRIAPTSFVNNLPVITYDTSFTVHWTGVDDGAGIVAYDIYAKRSSDAVFTKWLSYTSLDSAVFTGAWNDTLQFYSIAYDSVGNSENKAALIEASTILQNPVGIQYIINSADLKVYPNPSTGKLTIETTLTMDGNLNIEIVNLLNQQLLSFDESASTKYLKKEIDLSNQADGVYLIRINSSGHSVTKKFILKK